MQSIRSHYKYRTVGNLLRALDTGNWVVHYTRDFCIMGTKSASFGRQICTSYILDTVGQTLPLNHLTKLNCLLGNQSIPVKWSNLPCFCRFRQPVHFSRFRPDNLLLSTARFAGYNLEKCTGWLNLQKKGRLDHFTGIDWFPNRQFNFVKWFKGKVCPTVSKI